MHSESKHPHEAADVAAEPVASGSLPQWSRTCIWTAAGFIFIAVVVAYLPAVRGGFVWDDDAHVTKPELRSLSGLYRIWFKVGETRQYYPLVYTAFWIEHKLWGDQVIAYHLLNIVLHVAAAVMVMFIVRRLLREKGVSWADPAAFLTAAVFALHPVHVESVAWITEQKNTLSAVFYLSAMLAYLNFEKSRLSKWYQLATVLFVLGLLTKTVTATMPAALLVIFWWLRGKLSWERDVSPLLRFFVLGAGVGLFTAWVEHGLLGEWQREFQLSAIQRFMLAGRVVWFYIYKLLWPAELVFSYPRWTVHPSAAWEWLFPVALVAAAIILVALAKKSRAPLAAFLFFAGSLFPVLGFFNVFFFLYSFVADHFQYLPSLGIFALICGGLTAGMSRLSIPWVALLALPAVLGVLTFRQCRMYADAVTLYETTIDRNPASWMAHNNLGAILKEKGDYDAALAHYRAAVTIRPDLPEIHNNVGSVLNAMGRTDDAIASFNEALRLGPNYSDCARIHVNFGNLLLKARRAGEAVEHFETAVQLRPDLAATNWNLALGYASAGRISDALVAAERARNLARASGEAALGHKIDAWMESCRARAGTRAGARSPI